MVLKSRERYIVKSGSRFCRNSVANFWFPITRLLALMHDQISNGTPFVTKISYNSTSLILRRMSSFFPARRYYNL